MELDLGEGAEETAAQSEGKPGPLEGALASHEETVDALIKSAKAYMSALKAWKKACGTGHMAKRRKAAATAAEQAPALAAPTLAAASSWTFDVSAYLTGDEWRSELRAMAMAQNGLRTLEEQATNSLISAPVVVRTNASRETLNMNRTSWPDIRPSAVATELKRLKDRIASASSQELLESLYAACNREKRDGRLFIRLRDAYDLFALTPGWKKENPVAKFAQDIYALHRSGLNVTRGGKTVGFEYASGKVNVKDIFPIVSEDGRTILYYGVWFQ